VAGPFHSVVAHSVGAIATALAASDGQRFEKAVFLAPCCTVGHSLTDEARRQGLPTERDSALWDCFLETFGGDGSLAEASRNWQPKPPLLVIHDPDDDATPYAESQMLCSRWDDATLVDAPGCGHHRILVARGVLTGALSFLRASSE